MKLFYLRSAAALALLGSLAACKGTPPDTVAATPEHSDAALSITNAWIREAPAGAMMLAGYATLHNASAIPIECTAASAADFARVELHQSQMHDGMAKMAALEALVVPANGSATLAPGGNHLMLMHPARALKAGDTSTLTLHCGDHRVDAAFTVRVSP